jgi:putative phage-type endonuclease
MKVTLDQQTDEWLKWRGQGIGASDAAAIMHASPFKTPYQLWLEKTGRVPPQKQTRAMAHGVANEETAREQFIREHGIQVAPACFEYDDEPLIRASLDGWNEAERLVVEIKSPTSDDRDHRKAKEGSIPDYYWIQMQHQMAVADAKRGIYYSWVNGEGVAIPVRRSEDYWFDELLPAEQEFLRRVRENAWPEPRGTIDKTGDEDLRMAFVLRREAKWRITQAEAEQRLAESLIRRTLDNAKTLVCEQEAATWTYRKGATLLEIEIASPELLSTIKAAVEKMTGVGTVAVRQTAPRYDLRVMKWNKSEPS